MSLLLLCACGGREGPAAEVLGPVPLGESVPLPAHPPPALTSWACRIENGTMIEGTVLDRMSGGTRFFLDFEKWTDSPLAKRRS